MGETKDQTQQQSSNIRQRKQQRDGKRQGKGGGGKTTNYHISLKSGNAVPNLRFGASSNFDLFKKKIAIACMERYKNLGRLILDKKYY